MHHLAAQLLIKEVFLHEEVEEANPSKGAEEDREGTKEIMTHMLKREGGKLQGNREVERQARLHESRGRGEVRGREKGGFEGGQEEGGACSVRSKRAGREIRE